MDNLEIKAQKELADLRNSLKPTGLDAWHYISNFDIKNIPLGDLPIVTQTLYNRLMIVEKKNKELQGELGSLTKKQQFPNLQIYSDFTAIDFETANNDRMACQLGIIVVRNKQIVHEKSFLIRPPKNQYTKNCIDVHHITPKMTETAPTFDEIWMDIEGYLENQIIVAHNIAFDIDVLKRNIEQYHLIPANLNKLICTMELHNGAKLDDLCRHYDIPLTNHHDALSDARACAMIYLKYTELETTDSTIIRSASKRTKADPDRSINKDTLVKDLESVKNKDTIFFDKRIVISGIFEKFPQREDLAAYLKTLGADINTAISGKTDIFIYGTDFGSSKMKKVDDIMSKGGIILKMDEKLLYEEIEKL